MNTLTTEEKEKLTLRIDIISDLVCPWCVIGYLGLQQAIASLNEELACELVADIHWQPFELNPNMPAEGQTLSEHMLEKYGSTQQQRQASRQHLIKLGQSLGFDFNFPHGKRIFNTFSAHQLLLWADEHGHRQSEIMMAFFKAYFTNNQDISDCSVLLAIVKSLGLETDQLADRLTHQQGARDVRTLQHQWQQLGITAVPTYIINEKYLISGGQTKEAFIQGLREIISA
jgi:predicted DsbA family dithiol-disulfide isomerase